MSDKEADYTTITGGLTAAEMGLQVKKGGTGLMVP